MAKRVVKKREKLLSEDKFVNLKLPRPQLPFAKLTLTPYYRRCGDLAKGKLGAGRKVDQIASFC